MQREFHQHYGHQYHARVTYVRATAETILNSFSDCTFRLSRSVTNTAVPGDEREPMVPPTIGVNPFQQDF